MSRRPRDLTPEQRVLVSAVKRVARQRARINATYVQEIVRAREQGVTYAAIAQAAGTSSQAVQEIVRRHGEVHPTGAVHPTAPVHSAGAEHPAQPEILSGGSMQLGGIAAVTAPVEEVQ